MFEKIKSNQPLVFLILAFVVRIIFWIINPNMGTQTPDTETYLRAGELFRHSGFVKPSIIMPLFPVLIALLGKFGALLLGVILSSLSCLLVYKLTEHIFKNKRAALIAMGIMAFYPYYIFYSYFLLTETLFTFLFIWAIYLLIKNYFNSFCVVATLAILTRPTPDFLFPILIIYVSFFIYKLSFKSSVLNLFKYFLIYTLVMSPWWLHNYLLYKKFIRLNTGSGVVFYIGNNNLKGQGLFLPPEGPDFSVPDKIENGKVVELDPVERDAFIMGKAKEFIKSEPQTFIKYFFVKMFRLWKPIPSPENMKSRPFYFFLPLYGFDFLIICSLIGFKQNFKEYWKEIGIFIMVLGYFTAVHSITYAEMRFRIPLDFVIILGASLYLANFFDNNFKKSFFFKK